MADFGSRPSFSQLGSYRLLDGLGFVYARTGDWPTPVAGTVLYWISQAGPWVSVTFNTTYNPSWVNRFPVRTMINAGETASFPDIEAIACVSAGIAAYA